MKLGHGRISMWMKDLKGIFHRKKYNEYNRLNLNSDSKLQYTILDNLLEPYIDFEREIMPESLSNNNLLVLMKKYEKALNSEFFKNDFCDVSSNLSYFEISNLKRTLKMHRLYELSLEEVIMMFSLIDRNNDGFIDQTEIFVAFNILKIPITSKEAFGLIRYAIGAQPQIFSIDFNDFLLLSCTDY